MARTSVIDGLPARIAALTGGLLLILAAMVPVAVSAGGITQLLVQLSPDVMENLGDNSGGPEGRLVGPGLPVVRVIGAGIVVVGLPEVLSEDAAATAAWELMEYPEVLFAEPDRRLNSHAFVPNDPRFFEQWSVTEDVIGEPASNNAQGAWGNGWRGSAAIVIAELDTGWLAHADIDNARVLPGYDFIDDPDAANDGDGRDPDPTDAGDAAVAEECDPGDPPADEDNSWHGLEVAGVMTATADNAVGIAGMDHFARLLPVRVLGKCGGRNSDILDAMRWAVGLPVVGVPLNPNPARVLNLSFGGEGDCDLFEQQIINEVVTTGAVVVVSAGNGSGAVDSPANCDNVIAVAAVGRDGARASYTNVGSAVTISAPGGTGFDGILSTFNSGSLSPGADTYALLQGTSITAPQVSAAVALMLAAEPDATLPDLVNALQSSARPFPDASCNPSLCGAGLMDVQAAIQTLLDTEPAAGGPGVLVDDGDDGGGGGGCSVSRADAFDPLLPAMFGFAWFMLWRRRCRPFPSNSNH